MGSNRDRITLSPLRATLHGLQGAGGAAPIPAAWRPLADLRRGDGTGGVLIRHRLTNLYALWTGMGSIESLPQHKVSAALAELESQ